MRIPIAIFTAIDGYAWQPGSELPIEFINEAKRMIGKFPDASMGELPLGGVALVGDRLVVLRYHLAKNMDSFGRNSLYVVLGAIPRDEAKLVNVKALLDLPAFATPTKPLPPMIVDYDGPTAESCPFDFSESFSKDVVLGEALPWLGDAVTTRAGKLEMTYIYANGLAPKVSFVYEAPPKQDPHEGKVQQVGTSAPALMKDIGHQESQGSSSVETASETLLTVDSIGVQNPGERIVILKPTDVVMNMRKYRLLVVATLCGWCTTMMAVALLCIVIYFRNETVRTLCDRIDELSRSNVSGQECGFGKVVTSDLSATNTAHSAETVVNTTHMIPLPNLPQMPEPDGYKRVVRKTEACPGLEKRIENEPTYAGLNRHVIDRFVPKRTPQYTLTNGCPRMILNEVVAVTNKHEYLSKIDAILKMYEKAAQAMKIEDVLLDSFGAPAFQKELILLKPTSSNLDDRRYLYAIHRHTSESTDTALWQLRGELWIWLGDRAIELVDISYYSTVKDAERASRTDVRLRLEFWSQKICKLLAASGRGRY